MSATPLVFPWLLQVQSLTVIEVLSRRKYILNLSRAASPKLAFLFSAQQLLTFYKIQMRIIKKHCTYIRDGPTVTNHIQDLTWSRAPWLTSSQSLIDALI